MKQPSDLRKKGVPREPRSITAVSTLCLLITLLLMVPSRSAADLVESTIADALFNRIDSTIINEQREPTEYEQLNADAVR